MPNQLTFDKQPVPIKLTVRGSFRVKVKREWKDVPIPSFKNGKMWLTKLPNGTPLKRPILITKPEFQAVMRMMVDDFVAQLSSVFQTIAEPTSAESSIQSWIALSMPADDCWRNIPDIRIKGELCQPGEEGANILIERI